MCTLFSYDFGANLGNNFVLLISFITVSFKEKLGKSARELIIVVFILLETVALNKILHTSLDWDRVNVGSLGKDDPMYEFQTASVFHCLRDIVPVLKKRWVVGKICIFLNFPSKRKWTYNSHESQKAHSRLK